MRTSDTKALENSFQVIAKVKGDATLFYGICHNNITSGFIIHLAETESHCTFHKLGFYCYDNIEYSFLVLVAENYIMKLIEKLYVIN